MTIALSPTQSRPKLGWSISLWSAQLVLAALFAMAGVMKTTLPMSELVDKMVWPGALPSWLVRFIGVAEFSAAVGLVLPAVTRIRPILTPLAASGLVLVMALAAIFHLSRGEFPAIPMNLAFGAVAAFVAWGRFKKAPISPH